MRGAQELVDNCANVPNLELRWHMPLLIERLKPQFPLWDVAYAPHPAKNYMFQLLYHQIQKLAPVRALDAGVGTLRNYWMFPRHYVGIGHNRPAYRLGLKNNQKIIQKKGIPEVYLMRLESDFSFLDRVDLCVCTQTIAYTTDRFDVARRLSDVVVKGGTLILEDKIDFLDTYISAIGDDYEINEITYWGHEGCDFKDHAMPAADIIFLSHKEMSAPNVPEQHAYFYLCARSKRLTTGTKGPRPEMIDDNGLMIVKDDMEGLLLE